MNLKPWKTIKAVGLALVMIGVWVAWLGEPALAETNNTVLILGPTVVGGIDSLEARQAGALGYGVEVASAVDWLDKSTADFATYKAIVLGDFGCAQDAGPVAAAETNRITWTPAVTGNVIVIGTAAAFYSGMGTAGATKLVTDGIAFAAAGTRTGAYISLNCYYSSAGAGTPVRVLDQFGPSIGTFTVEGVVGTGGPACDTAHIVATLPSQLADLTDADLSGWSCSVHESFVTRPSGFSVLAVLQASDGTGAPYIVARTAPTITDSTTIPTEGLLPLLNVPVDFEVTVADPTKVQSVLWDFDADGKVDQTTTTLTTQFTYPAAGTFQAMVTVINTDGGTGSATTPITVQSASEAVDTAEALVRELTQLNNGQRNSLTSKLNDARAFMTQGNITEACGILGAVVNQINAFETSGQLSAAHAAPVRSQAEAIQRSLDC